MAQSQERFQRSYALIESHVHLCHSRFNVSNRWGPGESITGANVDCHHIFVNRPLQTELELSSQDHAADPPDVA